MARLQAQADMEFIATQERVRPILRSYFSFPETKVNCLDPCCGPGDALMEICPGQNLYGVEIHTERALKARKHFKVLVGPIESSIISNRAFSFCHCNPPYDWMAGGEKRYEELFLYRTTNYLTRNGVLELIVPAALFQFKEVGTRFYKHLLENYKNIRMYKYPQPEFAQYKQIVILGIKKTRVPITTSQEWMLKMTQKIATADLPELTYQSKPLYEIPSGSMPVKTFRINHYNDQIAAQETKTTDILKSQSKPTLKDKLVAPYYLDKALLSLLAVGGYIDGTMPGHFLSGRYENKEEESIDIDPETGDEIRSIKKTSSTVFYVLQKSPGPDGSRVVEIR